MIFYNHSSDSSDTIDSSDSCDSCESSDSSDSSDIIDNSVSDEIPNLVRKKCLMTKINRNEIEEKNS